MESKMSERVIDVDASTDAANRLGDIIEVGWYSLTLRQSLVRGYMADLLNETPPLEKFGGDGAQYDEAISAVMREAAHRANVTLLIMASAQPLRFVDAEEASPIASPESAIIVRGGH